MKLLFKKTNIIIHTYISESQACLLESQSKSEPISKNIVSNSLEDISPW